MKILTRLRQEQRGQTFVEIALAIILVVFAVAPFLTSLGGTLGSKVGEITTRISQVGAP